MNPGYGDGGRAGIRHAYPLAVTTASFGTAFVLNLKTLPYAFVRFLLHAIHAVVAVIFFGALIVCALVVGRAVHPWAGIATFFAGGVIYGVLWSWWFRYVVFAVKCGHIACLTDLVTRGKVESGGEGMLAYGRGVVRDRFPDVVQVYLLQGLIRGVVSEFNMALGFVGDLLPFNLGFVMMLGRRLLREGTRYLDETLFSYSLIRRNEPLWDVCSEGLGYYFQNSKEILKTTIWTMFLGTLLRWAMWIVFMIVGVVIFLPIANALISSHGHIFSSIPEDGTSPGADPSGALGMVSAFMAALFFSAIGIYAATHAFLHPIYLTMVMTKYLIVIQTQRLDPSFEQFLGSSRANALRTFTTTQFRGNGVRSR